MPRPTLCVLVLLKLMDTNFPSGSFSSMFCFIRSYAKADDENASDFVLMSRQIA